MPMMPRAINTTPIWMIMAAIRSAVPMKDLAKELATSSLPLISCAVWSCAQIQKYSPPAQKPPTRRRSQLPSWSNPPRWESIIPRIEKMTRFPEQFSQMFKGSITPDRQGADHHDDQHPAQDRSGYPFVKRWTHSDRLAGDQFRDLREKNSPK